MFLSPSRKLLLSPYSMNCRIILMGSKHFLLMNSVSNLPTHKHIHLLSYSETLLLPSNCRKNSRIFASTKHLFPSCQRVHGCNYRPYSAMPNPRPINGADVATLEKQLVDKKPLMILKQKLQELGIDGSKCTPGQNSGLICPICKGWATREKSLSLNISEDGVAAKWICFRAKCGWSGKIRVFADVNSTYVRMNKIKKVKKPIRVIDEKSLELEPLGNELLAYFAERMISEETLLRNGVMQKKAGRDKIVIAFPYRRNGELVSCKYRDISFTKRFWQEASTEKIFYGLDDIKGASDIIIVAGEIDKLSMEEAGFKNCVSVPNGAPLPRTSKRELPPLEEDTKHQYVRNCKDYTAKASRIILATDGDPPGRALAEELARRLGRERCWRVNWPKKNETEIFKDANEVLKNLGADALRDVIHKAKSYQMQNID